MTAARTITVGAAALVVALAVAPLASGQYVNVCPDMPPDLVSATDAAIEVRELGQRAVTICLAETERLESIEALLSESIESETTTSAQRVALAPVDRNRLDLGWWGSWALVGTAWGLTGGFLILQAFRLWRE